MTERIIDFLDALVATVNDVESRYCLVEKREKQVGETVTNIPYEYVGNGNFRPVEIDGGSVSYFRLVNNISFSVVDGNTAIKDLQGTYPIRYVAIIKRDEVNPLTKSQDVANILEGRNKDLQTQLQARNVQITVDSIDTDIVRIWRDEFELPYGSDDFKRSMIMIDMTVTVIAKRECWQDCDDYPDILQGFAWCEDTAATVARLTEAQKTCISNEICGAPDPANVRNSDSSYSTTVASGATLVLPDITVTDSDGSTSTVPSVQNVTCTPCPVVQGLTVAASTTTPDLGDSVTITATPTNITPTSYTFYLPKIDGSIETVTQAGNSYVWTAEGNGAVEVTVSATDGTDTVHSFVEVTVDFPFVADDHSGMSSAFGFFKAANAYSGNCFQVQRSSDGAYLEVGWVNGCVADLESLRTWAGADEVKVTIWYDSTGNGNHLTQTVSGLQLPISNWGGLQIDDNGVQMRDNASFDMTSGGTNSPIGAATLDVYSRFSVNAFSIGLYNLFNRRANSGNMFLGQSGSTSSANSRFGTPSYYVDGSAIGTTRDAVYTAMYQTGNRQVSIIGGDTTHPDWAINMRLGELDFNAYIQGTQNMIWMWTTDTSAIRSTIEAKMNALYNVDIE